MQEQPAIKSYFFGKGYQDLKNTINDSWEANKAASTAEFDQSDMSYEGAFHGGSGVAIMVFGTIFFLVISALHVLILGIITLAIYLSFSLVWGTDRIYRSVNKIFTACPHCYKKFDIPAYQCPQCGVKHSRLHPGPYGILKRTCQCGQKLPHTFFNGRKKLTAWCPDAHCEKPIEAEESKPIVLPVIGAPSVGKTCFTTSMIYSLKEKISVEKNIDFAFTEQFSQQHYEHNLSSFSGGGAPSKTVDTHPAAMNIFLQPNRSSLRRILYLYDPAGEAYLDTSNTQTHNFYDYFHGAFFLIDPFSIIDFYHEYASQIDAKEVKPSQEYLDDVYDRMVINLEKNFNIKPTQRVKAPFAIIFSKVDVVDLENKIGATAGQRLWNENQQTIKSVEDGIDLACQQFLQEYGMGYILDKFKVKFKNLRFFSVASKGKQSLRIEEPLVWILQTVDKGLLK